MKHGQQNLPHAENDHAKIAVLISAPSPPKILNGISQTSISRRCSKGVVSDVGSGDPSAAGRTKEIPSSGVLGQRRTFVAKDRHRGRMMMEDIIHWPMIASSSLFRQKGAPKAQTTTEISRVWSKKGEGNGIRLNFVAFLVAPHPGFLQASLLNTTSGVAPVSSP
ncbi:uncharacterized protein PADG_08005 [Paracoccidioides brasiliensis Pb18]|uniref:Uncharacterized protein n=1 Tax=Paracoccidioides brasiliensis (strain Pb18) TaxID=502780 RepID=C1GKZ8_PARBD|nr:uncharacterized protein PADG_08005 [Paracoccidioides brasiliensis Pb18]EEH43185.1 hypothetical protein PADG_08005 [Paracoccidioides brasiliensis Pb18]